MRLIFPVNCSDTSKDRVPPDERGRHFKLHLDRPVTPTQESFSGPSTSTHLFRDQHIPLSRSLTLQVCFSSAPVRSQHGRGKLSAHRRGETHRIPPSTSVNELDSLGAEVIVPCVSLSVGEVQENRRSILCIVEIFEWSLEHVSQQILRYLSHTGDERPR